MLEDGAKTIQSVKPRHGNVKENQATVRVYDDVLNVNVAPKNGHGAWLSAINENRARTRNRSGGAEAAARRLHVGEEGAQQPAWRAHGV